MLQKIEYGLYDSQRVQTTGRIKVVHGMAALHRWECLKETGLFNEDSITEDYYLTLVYKKMGYSVISDIKMKAWTIVPVKIIELFKQRIRWYRGGIDALRSMGWNRGTYKDILQHVWVNVITFVLVYIYANWIFYMIKTGNYHLSYHWLVLLLIVFCMYDAVYRIKNYVGDLSIWGWLIAIIVMPLYNQLQTALLYIYLMHNRSWERIKIGKHKKTKKGVKK